MRKRIRSSGLIVYGDLLLATQRLRSIKNDDPDENFSKDDDLSEAAEQ